MLLIIGCVEVAFDVLHSKNKRLKFDLVKEKHRDLCDYKAVPYSNYEGNREEERENDQYDCESRFGCLEYQPQSPDCLYKHNYGQCTFRSDNSDVVVLIRCKCC